MGIIILGIMGIIILPLLIRLGWKRLQIDIDLLHTVIKTAEERLRSVSTLMTLNDLELTKWRICLRRALQE